MKMLVSDVKLSNRNLTLTATILIYVFVKYLKELYFINEQQNLIIIK